MRFTAGGAIDEPWSQHYLAVAKNPAAPIGAEQLMYQYTAYVVSCLSLPAATIAGLTFWLRCLWFRNFARRPVSPASVLNDLLECQLSAHGKSLVSTCPLQQEPAKNETQDARVMSCVLLPLPKFRSHSKVEKLRSKRSGWTWYRETESCEIQLRSAQSVNMANPWINEWMNELVSRWFTRWINESMNGWCVDESMNQWINVWVNQWVNKSANQWPNESANQWMIELVNRWTNQSMNERMNGRMDEWMDEWSVPRLGLLFGSLRPTSQIHDDICNRKIYSYIRQSLKVCIQ